MQRHVTLLGFILGGLCSYQAQAASSDNAKVASGPWQTVCADVFADASIPWALELPGPAEVDDKQCLILARLAFDPPSPPPEVEQLVARLKASGYFEQVECSSVQACQVTPQRILRRVRITNAPPFPLLDREILQRLSLRSGSSIDDESIETARKRLQNYFQDDGFFDVTVRLETHVEEITSLHRPVDLDVLVEGGQKATLGRVNIRGDVDALLNVVKDPSDYFEHYWLAWLLPRRFSPRQFRDDVDKLEVAIRRKGWPEARLRGHFTRRGKKADVTIDALLGTQLKIQINGNVQIDRKELLRLAKFHEDGIIDEQSTDDFVKAIGLAYQRQCYPTAQVSVQLDRSDTQTAHLTLQIKEGIYASIQSIEFKGPEHLREVAKNATLRTSTSGLIDRCSTWVKLAYDEKALQDVLKAAGYQEVSVQAETSIEKMPCTYPSYWGPVHAGR
ncbi:MAG: POTRA domain-containing protein [Myxococcota bacterium]